MDLTRAVSARRPAREAANCGNPVAPSGENATLHRTAVSDEEVVVNGDPLDAHRARTRSRDAPARSDPQVHGARGADLPGTDRQDPLHLQPRGGAAQAAARQGLTPGALPIESLAPNRTRGG